MFATAIAYLESKTPTWIKVCVALVVVGWMAPIEIRDWAYNKFDTRVHAVIAPMKVQRDFEIKEIHTKLENLTEKSNETNAFVRAMAIEQLGPRRFEQVSLTAVDKGK